MRAFSRLVQPIGLDLGSTQEPPKCSPAANEGWSYQGDPSPVALLGPPSLDLHIGWPQPIPPELCLEEVSVSEVMVRKRRLGTYQETCLHLGHGAAAAFSMRSRGLGNRMSGLSHRFIYSFPIHHVQWTLSSAGAR